VSDVEKALAHKHSVVVFNMNAYTKDQVKSVIKYIKHPNLQHYIFCSTGAVYEEMSKKVNETFQRGKNPY
jgi:UDP-glucose 4-epimerase